MQTALEALALAGAILMLLAGFGTLRFPDVYARMHAATKASTLGIALIGITAASLVHGASAKAMLAVVFLFITAPSGAHLIGRAAYRAEGIEVDLASRDDLRELVDGDAPDPPEDAGPR